MQMQMQMDTKNNLEVQAVVVERVVDTFVQ
jgi:hypothetical protein